MVHLGKGLLAALAALAVAIGLKKGTTAGAAGAGGHIAAHGCRDLFVGCLIELSVEIAVLAGLGAYIGISIYSGDWLWLFHNIGHLFH